MLEATLILLQVQSSIEPDHIPCETPLGFESLVSICKIHSNTTNSVSKTATDSCFPSLPWSSSAEIVETAQGLRPPDLFTRREQGASADHRRPQASWHQRPKQLGSVQPATRCTATGDATVVSDHCRLEKAMLHLAGAKKKNS